MTLEELIKQGTMPADPFIADAFPEFTITFVKRMDPYSFQPFRDVYVDSEATGITFSPEALQDAYANPESDLTDVILTQIREWIEANLEDV